MQNKYYYQIWNQESTCYDRGMKARFYHPTIKVYYDDGCVPKNDGTLYFGWNSIFQISAQTEKHDGAKKCSNRIYGTSFTIEHRSEDDTKRAFKLLCSIPDKSFTGVFEYLVKKGFTRVVHEKKSSYHVPYKHRNRIEEYKNAVLKGIIKPM